MNEEIIRITLENLEKSPSEIYILITLTTGLQKEDIDKKLYDMIQRFLRSSWIREWVCIDNRLKSYRCCLSVLSKFENIEVMKLIKVFNKLVESFMFRCENWIFGLEYREVVFDVKNSKDEEFI